MEPLKEMRRAEGGTGSGPQSRRACHLAAGERHGPQGRPYPIHRPAALCRHRSARPDPVKDAEVLTKLSPITYVDRAKFTPK